MTNLANSIPVRQIGSHLTVEQVPIKSGSKIYQGAMVCLVLASGYAVRAGTAATGPVQGVARAESTQPTADGGANVILLVGIFEFPVHATHTPTIADVGKPVYASDDNTLSNFSSDGPLAGILTGFNAGTGWGQVYINPATNAVLLINMTGASGVTAGTTRTQAGATALTVDVSRVDTATAPSVGSTLGDGVSLLPSVAGLEQNQGNAE